ncbi:MULTISPECIES: 3-phosphoserine/phosphohydroxythreonine transaminase [Bacillus]|uniref:Phosphoserine aminotransferase n=1 Tax=Bacillus halotolerans TaxID=260554 RepID=A0ABY7I350_9BACI|nr:MULTISPECIES: 3-phosphoserine/phosphohydroxythreonine transaminase [Bacillus]QQF64833.1 3-phosphoserine/phosphohydroxythreonine transaminase [Bacillus mojavensis]KUP34041.1 3-phosphoserine/phosphohydroxythreonine aminotransferase [Bacillus halotolerans]MBL4967872.1 3-phosphoserine/phosphohydroxythreonine transaminase [Bacillus halotolerans]MBL4971942.1 3-phosphoserine/phosphohydroxythreonine transaminase [Bacillus halotolerans]MBL4975817.1 3-phosphoserine/phosphohydroxythreonine transaminas
MERTTNFNAGPAALPLEVLQTAQKEFIDFNESGMSVMELSHRSKEYEAVHQKAKSLLIELMGIPEDYDILFLQGGASLQFSMLPMNFLTPEKTAHFVMTGAWSEKALAEAKLFGNTSVTATSESDNYSYIPEVDLTDVKDGAYLHITSNNTIFGTQWQEFPNSPIPLVADMSSDILSRKIDVSKFDVIYGGAQKNLGPSGVTVVVMKKSWLQNENDNVPKILKYSTHVKADSLYNTPPTFAIYMLSLVLEWLKKNGGVEAAEQRNEQKAQVLYSCIDESNGFYKGHARKDSRSRMNVTFTLRDDELTKKFVQEAKERKMVGLGGHRSVGGCRASIYNAVSLEDCEKLAAFMKKFQQENE